LNHFYLYFSCLVSNFPFDLFPLPCFDFDCLCLFFSPHRVQEKYTGDNTADPQAVVVNTCASPAPGLFFDFSSFPPSPGPLAHFQVSGLGLFKFSHFFPPWFGRNLEPSLPFAWTLLLFPFHSFLQPTPGLNRGTAFLCCSPHFLAVYPRNLPITDFPPRNFTLFELLHIPPCWAFPGVLFPRVTPFHAVKIN